MSIFLCMALGFITFYYSTEFWDNILQPEIGIFLPYIGAALGGLLGYFFHKKSDLKLPVLFKNVNNIVALLFLILGGIGSLFFGSLVFKYLFSSSYCENLSGSLIPCGGPEIMSFILSMIILTAGILGFIASRNKSV